MKVKLFKVDGSVEDLTINTFRDIQNAVGGLVEMVDCGYHTLCCDEEGLLKDKELNVVIKFGFDVDIVGDVVVIDEDQLSRLDEMPYE